MSEDVLTSTENLIRDFVWSVGVLESLKLEIEVREKRTKQTDHLQFNDPPQISLFQLMIYSFLLNKKK